MILERQSPPSSLPTSEDRDKPPPYSTTHFNYASTLQRGTLAQGIPDPAPSVNQVHIHSRDDEITGSFYIDPQTPALDAEYKKRGRCKRDQPLPHASFRSRRGDIKINLATTGNVNDMPKATVSVTTRSGNIWINLLPTPVTKPRIGLEIETRRGDIIVFIPKTFSGVIRLTTRKGDLIFLPALSTRMQVLKTTTREALVMVGNKGNTAPEDHRVADLCQLSSRNGKVVVGLRGEDQYEAEVGFWKKIGNFLRNNDEAGV